MRTDLRRKSGRGRCGPILVIAMMNLVSCGNLNASYHDEELDQDGAPHEIAATDRFSSFTIYQCLADLTCVGSEAKSAQGQLILLAANNSNVVQRAHKDVVVAEQALTSQRLAALPSLGIEGQVEGGSRGAVASISQPIWSAGRMRATVQQAKAAVDVAKATLAIEQMGAALDLLDAHATWTKAHKREAALELTISEHEEILRLVRERIQAGLSSAIDLQIVESRLSTVRLERLKAQTAQAEAESQIRSLVGGSDIQNLLREGLRNAPAAQPASSNSLQAAYNSNPYIWLSEAERSAGNAALDVARADRFPSLTAIAEKSLFRGDNSISQDPRVYLTFSTNFGSGPSVASRIAEAKANLDSTTSNAILRRQVVEDTLASHEQRLSEARSAAKLFRTLISGAEGVRESYRNQLLQSGSKSWQDILDAARELSDARINEATNRIEEQRLLWRLFLQKYGIRGL